MDYDLLRQRLHRGWSIEKSLTKPYPLPPLAQCERLPISHLPACAITGYSVYDFDEELGEVYQLRPSYWTHSGRINRTNPTYSLTWRTRWEAIIDLLKSLEEAEAVSAQSYPTAA